MEDALQVYTGADLIRDGGKFATFAPPARLSVFGDPVAHSKSPGFQNAALQAAGIDAQYIRLHVKPEELGEALRALPKAGFLGTNVTIPHKGGALANVDEADDYARKSGAVNTVRVEGDRLIGFNTDGPGLARAVQEEFDVDLRDLRVLVLGAGGGAGRAIAVHCALTGCARLVLANRTFAKAQALADELQSSFSAAHADRLVAIPHEFSALGKQLAQTDIVINASSAGMKPTDPPILPTSLLNSDLLVYDAVYGAEKSRLIENAEAVGARSANGLSMLLHQGALAFEIWFNQPAPVEAMRAALLSA